MGHRKQSSPKRGSLAYSPRKRASTTHGHVRAWPEYNGTPKILGFAGFKVGMTHILMRENRPHSPYLGQEMAYAATIIEAPLMAVVGLRGYQETPTGKKILFELWSKEAPKNLEKFYTTNPEYDYDGRVAECKAKLDSAIEVRAILAAQPALSSNPQNEPIYNEYGIGGGSISEQFDYLLGQIGKEISLTDVFEEGSYIDTISVTKGKGFQGPVKRWGVKTLQKKSRKAVRAVGSIGPWKPTRMLYTVPRAGQTGFHQRTEYNLMVLSIGESGRSITPAGGFHKYGVVRSSYMLLLGSVPGPTNRFIRLRRALRPSVKSKVAKPEITYINNVPS